ncbi:MAG TPA: universal stress protein [Steroidobacteraceae bacterium]|nr:universal stress protein [Steroidobacteraceae bacterium]
MSHPGSILAVADGSAADAGLLVKALRIALACDARLELFLCDAEQAYQLKHAYEARAVAAAQQASLERSRTYLRRLIDSVHGTTVPITADVACESPLYEGIVRKIRRSHADLVLKSAGGVERPHRRTFDANDWQLMRNAPATLLLNRGRTWGTAPRFLAALDVSERETAGLAHAILERAKELATSCGGVLELTYAEAEDSDADTRQTRLATLRQLAEHAHLDVGQLYFLVGDPQATLQKLIRERNYDVIVIGALTHRPSTAPLVGTLTASLVDALDSDFVLVRRHAGARSPR